MISHFVRPAVVKREGGDPERELHRPCASVKLISGFPTTTFGNDMSIQILRGSDILV